MKKNTKIKPFVQGSFTAFQKTLCKDLKKTHTTSIRNPQKLSSFQAPTFNPKTLFLTNNFMHFCVSKRRNHVSHEKKPLLSIESWMVNRDPYNGL